MSRLVDDPEPQGGRRTFNRDLPAAVIATTAMALPSFLIGTMAVEVRQTLHFGPASLGLAIGGYYLGAAISSVPGSRLVEAIGGARVMRLVLLASAVIEATIAGAATSWVSLSALLLVAGALSGVMSPGVNLFLARRTAKERQGLAFGLKQSAVPLASLLGGLAVPAIALSVGWRWAFFCSCLISIGASLVVPPSRTTLADRRQQQHDKGRPAVDTVPLVILGTAFGLGVLAASSGAAFLVSAAVQGGFAKGTAGLLAALAAIFAIGSRIVTGFQADRRGREHLRVVAVMQALGAAGYFALASAAALGSRQLLVAGAVVALGLGWGWNGLLNFAVIQTHPHAPAAATGITQVGGRLGGLIGPVLVGLVVSHGSYADAWLVPATAMLCASSAVLLGRWLLSSRPLPAAAPAPPFDPGVPGDASGVASD